MFLLETEFVVMDFLILTSSLSAVLSPGFLVWGRAWEFWPLVCLEVSSGHGNGALERHMLGAGV